MLHTPNRFMAQSLALAFAIPITASACLPMPTGTSPSKPPSVGAPKAPSASNTSTSRLPHIPVPPALAAISIPLTADYNSPDMTSLLVAAKKAFPSKQIRVILPDQMYTQEFNPERINLQLTPNATHTQLVVARIYPG